MTWKPTDEMVRIAWEGFEWGPETNRMLRALIAVQPLIAAEARAKALEEAAALFDGGIDTFSKAAALSIRSLIPKPPANP